MSQNKMSGNWGCATEGNTTRVERLLAKVKVLETERLNHKASLSDKIKLLEGENKILKDQYNQALTDIQKIKKELKYWREGVESLQNY